MLSENGKLEKQKKKLQLEINKMVQSKEVIERMKELCKERNSLYIKALCHRIILITFQWDSGVRI